jgi:large subunit ribosomal protein L28
VKSPFLSKEFEEFTMAGICQVTGKKPMYGNRVSHSNIKTPRRQNPNVQKRRFWIDSEQKWVKLSVSARGIRIINKRGIDAVVRDLRARGISLS